MNKPETISKNASKQADKKIPQSSKKKPSQKQLSNKDLIAARIIESNVRKEAEQEVSKSADKVSMSSEPHRHLSDLEDEKKLDELVKNQLSDISSDDFSIKNVPEYEENMPRLDENDKSEDEKKPKRKFKKIKFNKSPKNNDQNMDFKSKGTGKKEKASSKPKKSYYAYLEHPKLKHQPTPTSPKVKVKNDILDPFGLASRPKRK